MTGAMKTVLWILGGCAVGGAGAYGIKKLVENTVGDAPRSASTGTRSGWTPPSEESTEESEDPDRGQNKGLSDVMAEREHPQDSDEYDGETSPETMHKMAKVAAKEPYVIDDSQFYNEEPDYDKNSGLTFYQENSLLVDENQEIISFAERILGESNLEMFKYRLNGDVVYIRNDTMGADYEIAIDAGRFQSDLE